MTFIAKSSIIILRNVKGASDVKIYEYSKSIKFGFSASVVALGLFDGVHKGHKALLNSAKREAEKRKLPLVVFTFFSENELPKSTKRLYSTDVKNELLEKAGADFVVLADFNKISNVSAESFVNDILIGKLSAELAVTGSDFRFGKGREGDKTLLSRIMSQNFKECLFVSDEMLYGKKVSTSYIKELLSEGKLSLANEFLGEAYFIEGKIVHGDGRGKSLGLPTVNIALQNRSNFIKKGVYYTEIDIGGKSYTGLTNIGVCPTFEAREVHAETFILNFSDTVYGEVARIRLLDYVRDEQKFKNKEELTEQIEKDLSQVKKRWQNGR